MIYSDENDFYLEFNSRCLCKYHHLKLVPGLPKDDSLKRIIVNLYMFILEVKLH